MKDNFIRNDFGLMPVVIDIAFYIKKRAFHDYEDIVKQFCKDNITAFLYYDINVLADNTVIKSKAIAFKQVDFDAEEFIGQLRLLSNAIKSPIYFEYGCQRIKIS